MKFIYRLLGGPQQEEEPMEDCIVVASQPQPIAETIDFEPEPARSMSQPEPSGAIVKRGRPRRSNVVQAKRSSPALTVTTRSRKRQGPMSGTQDDHAEEVDISRVIDTPAPNKARKRRGNDDVSSARSSVSADVAATTLPKRNGRNSPRVVIPATAVKHEEFEQHNDDEDSVENPDLQLRREAEAAASQQRSVTKPWSIIKSLKDVFENCKRAALSFTEEREIDNMLLDIRTEVIQAGRRGRDQ